VKWVEGSRWLVCITMPNFVAISQTVAEIYSCCQNWRPPRKGGENWVPIEHNVAWAEAYLHTKWYPDPYSHRQGCKRDLSLQDRDETETFVFWPETRPRPRPCKAETFLQHAAMLACCNARIASVVLATAIPSVCLSVRLSVTRRYCVKTMARSMVQFAL